MLSRRTVSLAIAELLVIHGLELRSAAGYDLRSPIYDIGVDKCGLGPMMVSVMATTRHLSNSSKKRTYPRRVTMITQVCMLAGWLVRSLYSL